MVIKLTNQQAEALAYEIKDRIIKPYEDTNKLITDSLEYINFTENDSDCKLLTIMQKKYNRPSNDFSYLKRIIKDSYFEKSFVKIPNIKIDKIQREIVLATIDATDTDTLIENIIKKFKV